MAGFRDSVQSMWGVIPVLGGMYFWVNALTSILADRKSDSASSSAPTPAPSPASLDCNLEKINNTMKIWVRWMALLLFCSIYMMYHVRETVEALAAEGTGLEEDIHKAVLEEQKEAIKAVEVAFNALAKINSTSGADYLKAQQTYVTNVGLRNVAAAKVTRTKPKEGLGRLLLGRRRRVRSAYLLANVFFLAAGVCAAVSYYLSLRIQVRCNDSAATIIPFLLVGVNALAVFLKVSWVAVTKD